MPRARSEIARKYREKARRERKETEFVYNKMLSEWIKCKHCDIFAEFNAVYTEILIRNPAEKNLFMTSDWKQRLLSLNGIAVSSIEQQMEEEMVCLRKDFHPILSPSLPVLTPVHELLPLADPEPRSLPDFDPISTTRPISTPEFPIPSPDPEPLPSPQPDPKPEPLPLPNLDSVLNPPEMDLLEEISKYITDFDFEVEMDDFDCIESFDYETLDDIGPINF